MVRAMRGAVRQGPSRQQARPLSRVAVANNPRRGGLRRRALAARTCRLAHGSSMVLCARPSLMLCCCAGRAAGAGAHGGAALAPVALLERVGGGAGTGGAAARARVHGGALPRRRRRGPAPGPREKSGLTLIFAEVDARAQDSALGFTGADVCSPPDHQDSYGKLLRPQIRQDRRPLRPKTQTNRAAPRPLCG